MLRGFRVSAGELLIVVALVTTVGLGTVHTLSEHEARVLMVQAQGNMRMVAEGLEAYRVEWGIYPYDGYGWDGSSGSHEYNHWYIPVEMTTPVAYVTAEWLEDPFPKNSPSPPNWQYSQMRYTNTLSTWGEVYDHLQMTTGSSSYLNDALVEYGQWRLLCVGPDGEWGPPGGVYPVGSWPGISAYPSNPLPYDPTNGADSWGDVLRTELHSQGYGNLPPMETAVDRILWSQYR